MTCKSPLRFLGTAIIAAVMVLLTVALAGVSADGDEGKNEEAAEGQEQSLPIPEKAELKYPNLGSYLDGLVVQVEGGETTSQDAASDALVHSEESVAVTIYLTGSVDEVVSFLEENGGDPRNVGEDYIEAYVPVILLGQLSEQPGVIRVREIVPPQPSQTTQRITGHGPAVHGSLAWNQAGYSGQGVKVGVIDVGFRGSTSLLGTELPATVHARCYTDIGVFTQNLADCEAVGDVTAGVPFPECHDVVQRGAVEGADHGTIVAESVLDIAPEVELYIAMPASEGDLQDAAEWMASQGVSVINHSVSWTFDGPGDGTSPSSNSPLRTVDRAVVSDIIWVNAAGNAARDTWFGDYSDQDGDGLISFISGQDHEILDIPTRACRSYRVQLRWEDTWGGASTDLDLYLLHKPTLRYLPIRSTESQSGESGQEPFESFRFWSRVDSDDLGIVVGHSGGDAPDWIQLLAWGTSSIEPYTKNGSIGNPAESTNSGMLAVGAAHWNDVRAIEPYSSRGPTPDGWPKPDIVGSDCGATALSPLNEYSSGFCGTSQAAPHVAGMAALVRQRFPDYSPAQVASYLKDNAQQRQTPDPNNTWGHGFAKLPPPDGVPPTVQAPSSAFTRNPAVDFNTLTDAPNWAPRGIWSDGETMWVADWLNEKIYAYDMATKARVSGKDFDTLKAAGNTWPEGIWSDGETMWVADWLNEKIYAYDMATKARVSSKDFDTLKAAKNASPEGIWSDGETMWVADRLDEKIYAYDMATKARVPGRDFNTLKAAGNIGPRGIWSDGTTMWAADSLNDKVYAYDMADRARVPGLEFNTLDAAGNWLPRGIWSDGTTMWVSDPQDAKIYAYRMPQVDREALVAIYNATGGANWTNNANWLTNSPLGQWHGVTTGSNGRVTSLSLPENGLTGEIPVELGNLTDLAMLDLDANQLGGEIPGELGSLTKLTGLHITNNELSGEIPFELPRLARLETLALGGNQLTGTIPTGLGSLTDLEELYLWGNQLTGEIPEGLSNLTNLAVLSVSNNQLTGAIPTRLGSLTDLEELHLWGNQLTGEIPEELGNLAELTVLSLSRNDLTGEIPTELGELTNLERLFLNGNQLTGSMPSTLSNLVKLEELDLVDNQLTGPVPTWLSNLANLEELYLTRNQLAGPIPPDLGGLANLSILALGGNQLTGEIPGRMGDLTNLTELFLWDNQLIGKIPPELGNLANLEILELGGNELTGEVPPQLGNLASLTELHLDRNQLTSEIPPQLGRLANLKSLNLRINRLTGEIPTELSNLSNLVFLNLRSNHLTGALPDSLTGMTALTGFLFYNNPGLCAPVDDAFQEWLESIADTIGSSCAPADSPEDKAVLVELHRAATGAGWRNSANWLSDRPVREWHGVTTDASGRVIHLLLGGNQMAGEIPAELGSLAMLERLWLHDNQLKGEMPPELGNLVNLEELYLFDNQLTGTIPAELGGLINLTHLWLDGNQLSGEIPAELGRLAKLTLLYLSGNQLTGCVPDSLRDVADNDFVQLGLTFCTPEGSLGVTVSHAGMYPAAPVRIGTAIPVAAAFTKTVTGFTVDDVAVGNGVVGNFLGSGADYTFDVTPDAIGQVTVDIAANIAEDTDGNGNTAAAQLQLGIPYDDNRNGVIERGEVIKAVNDYLRDGSLERSQVIALINLYLSPPRQPTGAQT